MQGTKRIALADSVYDQVPGTFLTVAAGLPITGHYVRASRAEPYLGFGLELRSSSIAELLVETASNLPRIQSPPQPGPSINRATPEMPEARCRPERSAVLNTTPHRGPTQPDGGTGRPDRHPKKHSVSI